MLELLNKRPVVLSGVHSLTQKDWWIFKHNKYNIGHAWVCDGFRETLHKNIHNQATKYEYITKTSGGKFFHMNWG